MPQPIYNWYLAGKDYLVSGDFQWDIGALIVILAVSYLLSGILKGTLYRRLGKVPLKWVRDTLVPACAYVTMPAVFVLLSAVLKSGLAKQGINEIFLAPAFSLGVAWFLLRVLNCLTEEIFWRRVGGFLIITATLLQMAGLLSLTADMLKSIGFQLGEFDFNLFRLLQGAAVVILLLWISFRISGFVDTHLHRLPDVSPSLEVLFSKITKIGLVGISLVIGLTTVGLNLSSLAIFGGAIGLGLGFGLQKAISNLISGVILLLDKSIKPGDVISLHQTYGWINKLSARYVSVITRDGLEHLIPNEDLITNRVENWSFSNTNIRLRAPILVSYACDVRKAIQLCLDSAYACPRVLNEPAPKCHLKEFGDNGIKLELRFWIEDPSNGVTNIKSMVYKEIWDRFLEHGIEIPYPQRDLHLRSGLPLAVDLEKNGGLETTREE